MPYQSVVQELEQWVTGSPTRAQDFATAISTARASNIREMADIQTLSDYYTFADSLINWVPIDGVEGKDIFIRIARLYFVLDQPSVEHYQSPLLPPSGKGPQTLTWLSDWMVRYGNEIGAWMDRPESITPASLQKFWETPVYNMDQYVVPDGGWRTFNEFFARKCKPGRRPIAAPDDPNVVVSPADFVFNGRFEISPDSTVEIKTLKWHINELLPDSPHKERFKWGTWMHGCLWFYDYHRVHAPAAGVVLEARVIRGQNYVQIRAKDASNEPDDALVDMCNESSQREEELLYTHKEFEAPNDLGYQFFQSRGLILLDTAIGLVAVLPVGMACISSVKLTVEKGQRVEKGDELAYFQFGGSDCVVLLEASAKASITAETGRHYLVGEEIARFD